MTPSPVIVEPCTELVGPLVTSSRDPLEMFSYFFNENFLHMIVHETNLFAAQSLAAANRNTTWETSIDELKAYLGFMIVMGVNRLPEVRDYWSRDEKLHNTFIASRITRDRFEEISRYLHFVDNTTLPARDEPGYHRLQKVLPVISEMKQRCLEAYSPHPQNSIDEAMIPFKGKVTYRINIQYLYNTVYMYTVQCMYTQYTCQVTVMETCTYTCNYCTYCTCDLLLFCIY